VTPDLTISGSWGLYSITPTTPRGKRWLASHCSDGERTHLGDALMCEGGDRCRAIVAAADRSRLQVKVNGVDMKGFGR
jgi:hypothetical protein